MKPLLLCVFLLLAVTSHAQTLWQGTRAGMSLEEVKALFPSTTFEKEKNRLVLEKTEILERAFHVYFYFKGDKLNEVALGLKSAEPKLKAPDLFKRFTEVLRSKYGSELSKSVTPGSFIAMQSKWLSEGTTIELELTNSINDTVRIGLSYKADIAKEADKL